MKYLPVFFCIVLLFSATTVKSEPVDILVAYENTDLPPFYYGEGDLVPEQPGIAVELLQILDKQTPEIIIHFRRTPWKRCLEELKHGAVDALFPASFKPSRQELGVYPTSNNLVNEQFHLINLSYFFYGLKNSPVQWDGKELKVEGVIGAPTGYSIVEDLKKQGLSVDDKATTTEQNLLKLITRRVTVVAAQSVTMDPLIASSSKYDNVEKITPPINTKANYLMLSHQFIEAHPAIAELIWSNLKRVREEHFTSLAHKYLTAGKTKM